MYFPSHFSETDSAVLLELIHRHPLGLLVSAGAAGLQATAVPFVHQVIDGQPKLRTHLARANAHWQELADVQECLVVFQGVGSYITPNWYHSKSVSHKVVPTWNYEMVQVRGRPQVMPDANWLREQIELLTATMEQPRATPWQVADTPTDFLAANLKAIVGVEITITAMQGKWKMSQNRSAQDVEGVIAGLSDGADPHANPVAAQIVAAKRRK